ncbi:MAG: asparagine synthase B [Sandaracinaceae bacterium]|nr:asparagine synthase B [Sandaracinaceae bacterium]
MCSIFAILEIQGDPQALRPRALELSKRMRHRGPDWSGVYVGPGAVIAHERLAIVDPASGGQPLHGPNDTVLAVNGEIYDHRRIRATHPDYPFRTGSDCEVILALYDDKGSDFLNDLNGIFAFVLYDASSQRYVIARDPMGVMPLYTGRDAEGRLYVASEMKALIDDCVTIEDFPPGHVLDSEVGEVRRYYEPTWREYDAVASTPAEASKLRAALEAAVTRQLMTDVPYGVLLSGGLDSSLVSALAARHANRRVESDEREDAWWPRVHSFAIGLEGSPDLAAAEVAAKAIGTVHHSLVYTFEEGLDAIRDVIWHLETYDVTTIRASTPMTLMARRIKAMGIKMVLSGEGADEIFAGYLYFHKAPNARELHEETVRKLFSLYKYDCLRANKSMAAWGVEARVPFLDRELLDVAMSFDPAAKMSGAGRMEKHILRQAADGLLPDAIRWRQKEQFSDGVGYGWIDGLKAHAEAHVTDAMMAEAEMRFLHAPPTTKEAYYYRAIFAELFDHPSAPLQVPGGPSIACSTPTAIAWDEAFAKNADPSGRAIRGVHQDSYE